MYNIVIEDRGRGIKPEQIARVGAFMQFERVVHEQQGLGLGLIIAKRGVELFGGKLIIDGQENIGTTITVSIPLAQ